jgi:hypothetical protein
MTRDDFIRRHQSRADAGYKDPHQAHINNFDLRASADETNFRESLRREEKAKQAKGEKWRSAVFTAADLREMEFPAVSYVIPDLIPEGLTILAGRPKIGKSWAALELAIGVAAGKPVFGGIEVEQGDVLYCALEDNQRRLKRRIAKLLFSLGGEWPKRLTLATQWRRLDQGGVEDIKSWCSSVSNPRLTILDTLAGVRPPRANIDSIYDGDYKALRYIHRFTNDNGIGSVALHHTRKMEADDPLDTISGSLGLAGAADTCLVLARTPAGTTLYVRGRDVEEKEHAISFSSETCRWSILGDAMEVHRSETRKLILDVLAGATVLLSPEQIAAATGVKRNAVDQRLYRMVKDGEVIQIHRGRYAPPDRAKMLTPHKTDKK